GRERRWVGGAAPLEDVHELDAVAGEDGQPGLGPRPRPPEAARRAQAAVLFEVRVAQLHAPAALPVHRLTLRRRHPLADPPERLPPPVALPRPPLRVPRAPRPPRAPRAVRRLRPVHHHRQRHAPAGLGLTPPGRLKPPRVPGWPTRRGGWCPR